MRREMIAFLAISSVIGVFAGAGAFFCVDIIIGRWFR
jgi:hypothetical protein